MTRRASSALQDGLREFQKQLHEAAVAETIRLIESPHFTRLTDAHVRDVSEYRPIDIDGERFFEHAWSRSKEAGAMLGFARLLGRDFVWRDLVRLRESLRGAA